MRHYKPHANVQFAYWPDVSGATKINREEGSGLLENTENIRLFNGSLLAELTCIPECNAHLATGSCMMSLRHS